METNIKDRFICRLNTENSKKTYDRYMRMFYEFMLMRDCFASEEELLKNVTVDDCENYVKEIEQRYKKNSINLITEVLKEFFGYVVDRHLINYKPTDTIKQYKKKDIDNDTTEKEILTVNETKQILASTYIRKNERNFEFNSARNRLLVALLSTTGLRISELLDIEMDWIELTCNGYVINIPESSVKNRVAKRLPVVSSIEQYFTDYKSIRMLDIGKNNSLLFVSASGKKLTRSDTNNTIKKMVYKAGIEKNISNHCFRHGLTQELESRGVEMSMIYKILGWSENTIISRYNGKADSPKYDEIKFKVCDILK